MRIKSEIWVKAYLRSCQGRGVAAVVVRRGDESAGAIYICVNRLDRTVSLYGPAPAGLEGDPPDPRYLPEGCSFAPRCPRAVDRCSDAEPPPVEVAPGRPVACIRVGEP